jgi:NCAIR mutase (PurE)-related protein
MDRERILSLLTALSEGKVTPGEAYEELKELPFKDLQFARLDSHRSLRQGAPEVIYCPGKTIEQIITIAAQLKNGHKIVVGTRADERIGTKVEELMPDSKYYPQAKMLIWGKLPESPGDSPRVGIISAGTADGPVAEEAYLYLAASAVATERISDVGVAGLHRLLDVLSVLRRCDVLIVIAGMDGVLPSVVGGLVEAPVIAVPTSVGYGASFDGLSALLTMLNSCAAGLTVVNIDNGFGAAAAALRVLSAMKSAKNTSSLPVI